MYEECHRALVNDEGTIVKRYGDWRPLGQQTQPRMRAHDIYCIHTMVGSLGGTDSYFRRNGYGGTESHWGTGSDGTVWQWQEISHTADANLDGNGTVLSVENADYGPGFGKWNTNDGSAVPAFSDAQVRRLIDLGYRLCLPGTHPDSLHASCPRSWDCYSRGIPARAIPDTKPGRRGIGWHALGVPGNGLVAGGVAWSRSTGKVCPAPRRIAQVRELIIPGIAKKLGGSPATPAKPLPPVPQGRKEPGRVIRWQTVLEFPAAERDGLWGQDTDNHSQMMANLARNGAPGPEWQPSSIKLAQRIIDVKDDGVFGPISRAAVEPWTRQAQAVLGVKTDGDWGATTQAAYTTLRTNNTLL